MHSQTISSLLNLLTIRELQAFGAILRLGTQHWKLFYLCMRDPIKEPKYWRDRAEATRAKAKRYYDLRQIRRMLRVAEEYDKIADRAEDWQRLGGEGVKCTLKDADKV